MSGRYLSGVEPWLWEDELTSFVSEQENSFYLSSHSSVVVSSSAAWLTGNFR